MVRLLALSLSMVSLLSSLFGEECARWISEHSPGQNLVCQPVSVSGRNEAFLRAAISEPVELCYHCSVSYPWQLSAVEVVPSYKISTFRTAITNTFVFV